MQLMIMVILLLGLIYLTYEDLRFREISVWNLLVIIFFAISYSLLQSSFTEVCIYSGINLFILLVQLVGVTLYYSIKHKRLVKITNDFIGYGDILFLLVPAVLFGSFLFTTFIIINLALIILLYLILHLFKRRFNTHIPFAGIVSMSTCLVVVLSSVYKMSLSGNDEYLLHYLRNGIN